MNTVLVPLHRGRRDRNPSVVAQALIDEVDAPEILQFYWTLGLGYAVRRTPRPEARTIWLHRQVLGSALLPGLVADHVNRDTLDNRRANLRAVTRGANNQNRDSYRNGSSRFRGVSWDKKTQGWRATAQVNGEWTWLGRYDDEEEAARVAARWRAEHMPFSFEEVA